MNIAVIGGGISGLSAAYYAQSLCPSARVVLVEASDRWGGVLRTERVDDYLIEYAADNFLRGPTAPWAETFCQDTGFADQLIPTQSDHRGAHIVWQGRLIHVPEGFQLMAPSRLWPLLKSPLLSPLGRLRMCLEPLVRASSTTDESLASFARRRLGHQAYERIVQPLVAGIFTADAEQLSVHAALPRMVQMVQEHGSLYRAMRHRARSSQPTSNDRGARYGMFVAPRQGMQQWIDHLVQQFDPSQLRCGINVRHVSAEAGQWKLHTDCTEIARKTYDAVILAVPSFRAADLVEPLDDELAGELQDIAHASSAVVVVGYERKQIGHALDAFGSVVPAVERRPILAISYASNKFPGRAARDRVLLRIFFGGALQPDLVNRDDAELLSMVQRQLEELLDVRGMPHLTRVIRWRKSMPQYHLGHLARCDRIERRSAALPGLFLAGNGYRGVGIPQCVRSGHQAAQGVQAYLASR